MKVAQIASLMNEVTSEILGNGEMVQEDLSNVVDIGKAIFDVTNVDNYVKTLVDRIGKVVFVNRVYAGSAPSVLMDAWEFGSVMEKIRTELPNAVETSDWQLENGKSYDPNVFTQPKAHAKFFNNKVTFEIDMSFAEKQVKESFSSAAQLNAFVSMLYTSVDNSLTVKTDALIMRTINNMTALTLSADYPDASYSATSGTKAVNLLKLFNDEFGTTITKDKCMTNPEFIKFASYMIGMYSDRITRISTLFNIGGKERFTPKDSLHLVLLTNFAKSANVYLQSSTFHEEYTALPNSETVPYWQGTGTQYDFNSVSKINVKNGTTEVETDGVLGVMFDTQALGVCNVDRRVTTQYNPKGEFFNNFYKFDASYYNDVDENYIVFFVA